MSLLGWGGSLITLSPVGLVIFFFYISTLPPSKWLFLLLLGALILDFFTFKIKKLEFSDSLNECPLFKWAEHWLSVNIWKCVMAFSDFHLLYHCFSSTVMLKFPFWHTQGSLSWINTVNKWPFSSWEEFRALFVLMSQHKKCHLKNTGAVGF